MTVAKTRHDKKQTLSLIHSEDMQQKRIQRSSIVIALCFVACGGSVGSGFDAGNDPGPGRDSGSTPSGDANNDCDPPDMFLLVDRTMSMARTPEGGVPASHTASKWSIAVNSIEGVTTELEDSIRFGLALFPIDPGNGLCVTLEERLAGQIAFNEWCEEGEELVVPGIGAATAIASTIDVETTRLCISTPIGAGLVTVKNQLSSIQAPDRKQFVILLTDGEDTCSEDLAITTVQAMAAEDVKTYVIGFDSSGGRGVDIGLLNDLACAGGTAAGFPAPCTLNGSAYTATDRDGTILFQLAEDAEQLTQTLKTFAGEVCCGCID